MARSTTPVEYETMREVWRQAAKRPEGLTIPCGSQAAAIRARFTLYNAVKVFRTGSAQADQELAEALEACSISFTPDKAGLVVQRRTETALQKTILDLLEGPARSVEDRLADEMAARMQARMAESQTVVEPLASASARSYGARG